MCQVVQSYLSGATVAVKNFNHNNITTIQPVANRAATAFLTPISQPLFVLKER